MFFQGENHILKIRIMNLVKQYFLTLATSISFFANAQNTYGTVHYPQMYANQTAIEKLKPEEKSNLSAKEQVDVLITKMFEDPVMRNAEWGFVVYDPKTKKIINSYNENTPLIPASTTKLLTTETALSLLGGKFRWITQLDYSGEIDENGVLNGNLYIVGSGDPSLGTRKAGAASYSEIVSDFTYAILDKGIKKINGNIVIQTAVFKENKLDKFPENIVWLEQGNYFLPVGSTANIDPKNEKSVIKQKSPFDGDAKRFFYISPYTNKVSYAEQYEPSTIYTKLPDAPTFLANSLKSNLAKKGISVGAVTPRMTEFSPEKRIKITAYQSPTLSEIVYDTNQRSDNGLAEALLRMVGFQKMGNQGSESGKEVVVKHLENESFDTNGLNYMDGSGLSRAHRVTPISQVKYLTNLMKKPYYKDFYDSLPIAGQTGTLKSSFQGIGYGQIFAKTGTLNKVKTLAGYIKTRTGKTLAFSLLINNYAGSVGQVKSRMEEILSPLVDL